MAKNKITTESEDQPTSGKDLIAGLAGSSIPTPDPVPTSIPAQEVDPTVDVPQQASAPVSEAPVPTQVSEGSATSPASPDNAARYVDRIKNLGFSDVKDEQDAMDRLLESYEKQRQEYDQINQAYQQAIPFAQYGQQYLQQMQTPAYQEFMKQRQAPQPQQPDPRHWWNPPSYDPAAIDKYREVVVDQQTGQPVIQWKWNTPAEVRSSVDSWNSYREQWAEALVNNPQAALQPFKREVMADVYEMVRDMYSTSDQERQVQDLAEQILEHNKEWLYAKDPRTNDVARDPLTGKARFSELGEYAAALVEHAEKIGVRDFSEQWDYAVKGIRSLLAERSAMQQQSVPPQVQQMQQAPTTGDLAAQKKQELLARSVQGNGANSIPSRGGSEPPSDSDERRIRSQNKNLSAGKKILAELKRSGSLVG